MPHSSNAYWRKTSSTRERRIQRTFCSFLVLFAATYYTSTVVVAAGGDGHPAPSTNGPFFIVSTVDGSIGVLKALDGSLVYGFRSGDPLVGPSEILSGGRRIVPGLDGGLYVSLDEEDGLLQPLEITIVDVLQTPVKTCSVGGTRCGIVTATKSTSLFALDALTGRLVWNQSPNGTTVVEDEAAEATSTVLLQREDVLVQQLSTDSGKGVWNVTLGTVQALEFGEGGAAEGSLPVGAGGAYLPSSSSASTAGSRQLLMKEFSDRAELPSVIFGTDGTSLMAVAQSESGEIHVLWKRDFPTVVATVFGLQDRTWKPLTVLDNPEAASDSETNGERPRLASEQSKRSPLTVYQPPVLKQFYTYWTRPMSLLDRLAEEWFFATGQVLWQHRKHQFLPSLDSSHAIVAKRHTLTPLLGRPDAFLVPPRLALPSKPFFEVTPPRPTNGIFLTWPILIFVCLVVISLATAIFRYLYMRKRTKWLELLQHTVRAMGDRNNSNQRDTGNFGEEGDFGPSSLRRSQSLPDVGCAMPVATEGGPDDFAGVTRRLRSESLQICHTTDGRVAYEKDAGRNRSQDAVTSTTAANTSNKSQPEQQQQEVGFLMDGIPLIRYNRYDSEFSEVAALGKGGFGTVFRCKNVLDGREYAIKKVALKYKEGLPLDSFRQQLQRTLREVKSLALLDHPNIVRYYTAWLELQQRDEMGDSHRSHSQQMADSDYYLFSPSGETRTLSKRHLGDSEMKPSNQISSDRRPNLKDRHYLQHGYQNTENPLGGWNALDETTSGGGFGNHHVVQGVPAALDDYGFTFDRGDETSSDIILQDSTKSNTAAKTSANNEKSIGFVPDSPIVHQYSYSYSTNGAESSIEGSISQSEGWSQESSTKMGRGGSLTDTSTEGKKSRQISQSKSSKTSSIFVKHILYIQMQFCSQKTLADFLNNAEARQGREASGKVDVPYALSLFLQIAQGVEHVHSQGLIHRDLKPNNCFIDDSGAVKVGDFGLSRESSSDNRGGIGGKGDVGDEIVAVKNNDEEITAGVGTRSYASPEQMKGSDYDSSTDIYSLGIILFELVYPMYTGMERTIVLSKLRNHVFPDEWMKTVEPAFPTLHSLLQSMISNSPAIRPTAVVVVRNIQAILEGFTISSIDKHHHENAILLRVESKPRDDVLRHTIDLVRNAACPNSIEILQYGLRGGTNKAIMEFAILSLDSDEQSVVGEAVVERLGICDEILLVRRVSGTKYI